MESEAKVFSSGLRHNAHESDGAVFLLTGPCRRTEEMALRTRTPGRTSV